MNFYYFYVQTNNPKIKLAAAEAERFLSELVAGNIELPEFFTHTSDNPTMVKRKFSILHNNVAPTPVREYTSSWFYRNVLGYFKNGRIHVNTRFSSRATVAEIAGNLVHELCHARGYGHKGNSVTPYNLQSVPYVLGYAARDWVASK